ncbi:ankyrin repeat-containing domain protein [Nemania sp. FL0031]|nr:ankyrin repeat-containing domain protein [Nemania sp. FL0031]
MANSVKKLKARRAARNKNKSATCEECGRLCKSSRDLISHKRKHKRIYPCPERSCHHGLPENSFTTQRDLARHQDHVHGKKSTQCLYCLKILGRQDNLPRHISNSHGEDLLSTATDEDKVIIKYLLWKETSVELKWRNKSKLLLETAKNGREGAVKLLLSVGAKPESFYMYSPDETPTIQATLRGYTSIVELLLNHGAYIECKDEHRQTPLIAAASKGYTAIVELLLNHGAYIECKDEHRQTPLIAAASKGYTAIVELLLNHGAYIECTDEHRQTPLIAAASKGYTAIVELLLSKGANAESKDRNDRTPLMEAVIGGHTAIAGLLLNNGANVESKDKSGYTSLTHAAIRGNIEIVELLLNNGASIEYGDTNQWAPLSLAAHHGHEAIVELLLSKGANINSRHSGKTPVYWAAQEGHAAVVKLLLGWGADIEEVVEFQGHPAIAELLLSQRRAMVDATVNGKVA